MNNFNNELILEITLLELLLCGTISLFGSSIHVLCFKYKNNTKHSIRELISEILTNAIIDTFISIATAPFVMQISPRLILIPPLILGLLGSDFIKLLTSINGIFSIFERLFKLYNHNPFRPNKEEESKSTNDSSSTERIGANINIDINKNNHNNDLICNLIISTSNALINEMDISISNYYSNKDAITFYTSYLEIDMGYNNVRDTIEELECVPVGVYSKIIDLVKKKSEFEQFYKDNVKGK
jgi:hypothetical protein